MYMKNTLALVFLVCCTMCDISFAGQLSSSALEVKSFEDVPISILRAAPGPVVSTLSTYPNFIEFQRSGQSVKGSIGALGSFEMNMSANMDYADGVHRLYEKTQDAYWLALNTQGLFMQFAPAMNTNGDVWDESGKKYAFVLTMGEASFRGDIKPMDNGETSLGAPGMAFKGIHIDSEEMTVAGPVTINKSAGRIKFSAGQSSVVVTSAQSKTSSHIFANVATKGAAANSAQVTPGAGSFEVTLNSPADKDVSVDFFIVN